MATNGKSCSDLDMPRPRPKYLLKEITRHGVTVWYVRKDKGPRIRIAGAYGSPEFTANYEAAIAGTPNNPKIPAKTFSLAWLIERYRESSEWLRLSTATRRQRENIFLNALKDGADVPFAEIDRKAIKACLHKRRAQPAQAGNFLKAMRGLFEWAVEAEHIETNPTFGVKAQVPRTDGFHAWTEEEIERFEAKWPIGTRERLAFAILLYTGLRRGDAASLGRQHVKDGVISLRTEKTGTPVVIPVLPELAEIIVQTKTGDLAFIASANGAPLTKESFGNWFKESCKAANVPGSAHGLRKAGATRAANNGATVAQLEAIYGWTGGAMASHYTRKADRVRLARDAMSKLSKGETVNAYPRTAQKGAGKNSKK